MPLAVLRLTLIAACLPLWAENTTWRQSIARARDLLRVNDLAAAELAYRDTERVATEAGDVEKLAVTRVELGYVLSLQSRLSDAEILHEESIRALHELDPRHPALAIAHIHSCEVHWRQGLLKEAQSGCESALAIQERNLGKKHTGRLHVLNLLAGIHLDRRQLTAARRYLDEAMAGISAASANLHAAVLANVGRLQQDLGKLPAAEESLTRARRLMESLPDADIEALLTVLNNIATVQSRLGRHQQAEASFSDAAARATNALGPNHPTLAFILLNHGVELARLKRFDAAEHSMLRALEIQRNTLSPSSPNLAMTLSYYSRLLERTGRKKEAREMKSEAQAIYDENAVQDATVSLKELEMNAPTQGH